MASKPAGGIILAVVFPLAIWGSNGPGKQPPPVTFYRDVLPILQKHCQNCHRPGEIAPMPLLDYAQVRPWAKAIRAAVAARKMPPWFADAGIGHFADANVLTAEEIAMVVHWADQGALEGNRKDAPPALVFPTGWNIQPDIVIQPAKAIELPAGGAINYKYVLVKTDFPSDLWIAAAELRPSNPRVLHHGKVWVRPPGSRWMRNAVPGEAYEDETQRSAMGRNRIGDGNEVLGKFNPGLGAQRFDVGGAAKFVPKGSDLVFELHYTSNGEPAADLPKIGLMLSKHPPSARYVFTDGPVAYTLAIPPRDGNAEVISEVTATTDLSLVYVQPHMHLRGKDYELRLIRPDGSQETVFKGPFNFQWQLGYEFEKPIPLSKGTRVVGIAHFDNSANNRFNPDPNKEVHWGLQNWDEMATGFLGVIVGVKTDPETVFRPSGPSAPASKGWLW